MLHSINALCFVRRKTLLEYSADDLAKQMTILDNELFQRVDVSYIDMLVDESMIDLDGRNRGVDTSSYM